MLFIGDSAVTKVSIESYTSFLGFFYALLSHFFIPPPYVGAVFCYVLLQSAQFVVFHISSVFVGVKFPFYYHKIKQQGYFKYIHIGMVLIAFLLPCISVGIAFGTGGFTLMDFSPTSTCLARDADVMFYAILLPFSILMAVGFSMMAVIFQQLVLVRRPYYRCDVS